MTVNTYWHDNNLDPSDYLTTADAWTTYVPYTGATGDVDLGTKTLNSGNLSSYTSLGAEILTNPNFTGSATGWTLWAAWSYSADAVHKSIDGTSSLSQYYVTIYSSIKVEIVVTNLTVGSFSVYSHEQRIWTVSENWTFVFTWPNSANALYGGISITPTNTSRFTIDSISIKSLVDGTTNSGWGFSTNWIVQTQSLLMKVDRGGSNYQQIFLKPWYDGWIYGSDYMSVESRTAYPRWMKMNILRLYDEFAAQTCYVSCENTYVRFRMFSGISATIDFQNGFVIWEQANTLGRAITSYGDDLFFNKNSYSFNWYAKIAVSWRDFNSANLSIAQPLSLGSEKLTNPNFTGSAASWTLGAGWAYSANTVVKNADGTGTLSQAVWSMVTQFIVGEVYTLSFTLSAFTVGSFTASAWGITLKLMEFSVENNWFKTFTFTAVSNTAVTFTPSNTSRFTIDTVTLKKHTAWNLGVAWTTYTNALKVMTWLATFTQTYSTATRTHSNLTSADIGAFTGGSVGFIDAAERDNLRTQINALRADVTNLKQVVNSLIDDSQSIWLTL